MVPIADSRNRYKLDFLVAAPRLPESRLDATRHGGIQNKITYTALAASKSTSLRPDRNFFRSLVSPEQFTPDTLSYLQRYLKSLLHGCQNARTKDAEGILSEITLPSMLQPYEPVVKSSAAQARHKKHQHRHTCFFLLYKLGNMPLETTANCSHSPRPLPH